MALREENQQWFGSTKKKHTFSGVFLFVSRESNLLIAAGCLIPPGG